MERPEILKKYDKLLPVHELLPVRLKHTSGKVRYPMYRLRNELAGGVPADLGEEDLEIIEFFEQTDHFYGWENFAVLWDVRWVDGKWESYNRRYTEDEEWNAVLRARTTVLPMRRKKANKSTDE